MTRKIKLNLSALEFDELCDRLDAFQRNETVENIVEACQYEMMFDLRMRLKMITTAMKKKITIAVSIQEAVMIYYIAQFDYHSALTNAAMFTIHEQIRKGTERYLTEVRELQKKCSNRQY